MVALAKILLYASLFGSLGFFALLVDPGWFNMPKSHQWIFGAFVVGFISFAVYSARLSFSGRSSASLRAFAAAAAFGSVGLGWFYAPAVVSSRALHQVVQASIRCEGASREPLNRRAASGLRFIESVCAEAEIARIRWDLVAARDTDERTPRNGGIIFWFALAASWIGVALMPSHVLTKALEDD